MKIRLIHLYVLTIAILALACLVRLDWAISYSHWHGLAALIILGVFSESVAINVRVARSVGQSSITFLPFLTGVVLFGTSAAVILALCIKVIGEFLLHRKPRVKAIFNVSQWIVTGSAAGLVFTTLSMAMGLNALVLTELLTGGRILLPFAGLVITFFCINYLCVSLAIGLDQGLPVQRVLQQLSGSAGANLLYGILISPLAIVVAVLYQTLGSGGMFFALLPLIFIRRSYLNNIKLEDANRHLLKALVKAIETRDPYTSGHSMRVSALARRIAEGLGLSAKRTEEVEIAALLHDIGKIEPIYAEILSKPGSLSVEERNVIESHVTKGVELLRSIAPFPPSVIASVRHHHEREDGRGYPDRLTGEEIPLGAKIIKVCDAVDAMLSDRPYRRALDLKEVREQLITYAGSQFDVRVVAVVVKDSILEGHRREVLEARQYSPISVPDHVVEPHGRGNIGPFDRNPITVALRSLGGRKVGGGPRGGG